MNIQRNIERNAVPFENVMAGQVYEVGNIIYLKIDPIHCNDTNATIIDSIDLDTGKPQENFLDFDDIVVLLNATLVIKD